MLSLFGIQGANPFLSHDKAVTRPHAGNHHTLASQSLRDPLGEPAFIFKDENRGFGTAIIDLANSCLPPVWNIKTIVQHLARLLACGLRTRFNPVALAFKRISGKRDTSAALLFGKRAPVDLSALQPHSAQGLQYTA